MIYQKHILPLNQEGDFLLGVYFSEHKVGGEFTRFSDHAYFAIGHIQDCDSLTEITKLCTIHRSANTKEARRLQESAKVQISQVGNQERGWVYAQHSEKANKPAVFVPRSCLASRNGRLVIGFECEEGNNKCKYVNRVVDVVNQTILNEQSSYSLDLQRVINPRALSADGETFVYFNNANHRDMHFVNDRVAAKTGLFRRSTSQAYSSDIEFQAEFVTNKYGRVSAGENHISVFHDNQVTCEKTYPALKGVFNWTTEASFGTALVSFSGDKGVIKIMDTSNGKSKVYYPHRGCKRDDMAKVKLSDDGIWMASKIHRISQLIVTNLESGESWPVASLEDKTMIEAKQGEFRINSLIPAAFAFIGDQLLISEENNVRIIDYTLPDNEAQVFVSEQGKPGARKPIRLTTKASIEKIIQTAKLNKAENQLKQFYSPTVKLTSKTAKKSSWFEPGKRGAPDLAASRFGGWPDLPLDQGWPKWQERPMSFLAQINLSEMHAMNPDIKLPPSGLLLFFIGTSNEIIEDGIFDKDYYYTDYMLGSDLKHRGGWKVIYADAKVELNRTTYQGDVLPELFKPCLLKAKAIARSLPDEHSVAYDQLTLSKTERDNYNEVLNLLSVENHDNQLMGYPELIQSTPPELFSASVLSGRPAFSFPEPNSNEQLTLQEKACEWTLLLQLSSDNNADFLWGDGGHLYFYGNRIEMAKGNFEETWLFYEN
ncbi:MAG: YwqG family protein [Marinicellaceae bacterium]